MNEDQPLSSSTRSWWESKLSDLAGGLQESGYAAVRAEIDRAVASGVDVLALRGSAIEPLAPNVLEAVIRGAERNREAGARGLPELRHAIAEKLLAKNRICADPETDILVTGGSKHGLYLLLASLLDPGDEVVFPAPSYTYGGSVRLVGGVPVPVLMDESQGYRWDPALLERAITPRTRVLLLNAPMTPVGFVPDIQDLTTVARLAEKYDLVILMDEAQEDLIFDGRTHLSMATIPEARDRTVTTYSMTKAHNLTGYRIGYLTGPPTLVDSAANLLDWSVLSNPYLPQVAATEALRGPQEWQRELVARAESNRDLISGTFAELKGASHVVPQGGMYHFLNVRQTGMTDLALHRRLLHEFGVPTEPGWISGEAGHLRMTATGSAREILTVAMERLRTAWTVLVP